MLLADVVTTSAAVAATRSRLAKVKALAGLLAGAGPGAVEPAVAFLAGAPRQGRTGAGWRTLSDLDVPPVTEPGLTVERTDELLQELSVTSGKGSTQKRVDLLTELFGAATAAEQEFLRRLMTGELRQGALEGVMLDAIASAAEVPGEAVRRAFMLSGRLTVTAVAALAGGEAELAAFKLEVGRPVRPMLASPAESLDAALTELGEVIVEYKMDGARIQVHKDGDEVHVYTRTLREITASVPELVELVLALPCRSVVLDGETLALRDDGKPRPFQETMSRFGATNQRELLLRPYFFDCLHLDGVDLLDTPLRERNEALRRAVGDHVIPGGTSDADQLLADSLAAGHEGVMVKALDSLYAAGRRGKAWQKVKPEHTLDLVVLAAEWGHGRRTGYLSNLHLGARDPDGGPPIMVGKTFKGMTDELLAWQTKQLQAIASSTEDYVVYVRPEFVVEIELDGAQVSPRYPGGVALRFARVLRYRPDKDPADADTIDAVRALLPGKA
ncbi:ATP-dependent DNA ligase [Kibdelosporangium phytohabitans]|uniref:Probable DNA ligase n=1 Tax=Kibdelosporangium phytohabitans TaxID=860235 RepID=A0A0N9HXI4_9PSEU|nr:ATP-dependent DNA ligase [Kibdelosporangium phytohabitans]ALG06596.1 DNA ligase [Kibdelosporangium phytohabitans]MBE1467794.1 DNA ligase-1 [Kibdelosporangium phytohabitans]